MSKRKILIGLIVIMAICAAAVLSSRQAIMKAEAKSEDLQVVGGKGKLIFQLPDGAKALRSEGFYYNGGWHVIVIDDKGRGFAVMVDEVDLFRKP